MFDTQDKGAVHGKESERETEGIYQDLFFDVNTEDGHTSSR